MNTGNGKNRKPAKVDEPRAVGLRFERGRIVISLADAREVSVPLDWYPSLEHATPARRSRWTMLGDGQGFHWVDLDLDLSVAGLTNGLKEAIPRPPQIATKMSVTPSRASA